VYLASILKSEQDHTHIGNAGVCKMISYVHFCEPRSYVLEQIFTPPDILV